MIRDLDETIRTLLQTSADPGSELAQADIRFDIPNGEWRGALTQITVNAYLYDVRENLELRSSEPIVQRSTDRTRAVRRQPLVRIDCSYYLTAWSIDTEEPILEQHRLLGQVLLVLLRNRTIPTAVLQGSLVNQVPPYPTVIASPARTEQLTDFWSTLDMPVVPVLNYVVTLALVLDQAPDPLPPSVSEVVIETEMLTHNGSANP